MKQNKHKECMKKNKKISRKITKRIRGAGNEFGGNCKIKQAGPKEPPTPPSPPTPPEPEPPGPEPI
jgi:hypothetical protein